MSGSAMQYQEYVQYILKIKILLWDQHTGIPMAQFLLRIPVGLLGMERRWIQKDLNATINAVLYYQLRISVCMIAAQRVSTHTEKE